MKCLVPGQDLDNQFLITLIMTMILKSSVLCVSTPAWVRISGVYRMNWKHRLDSKEAGIGGALLVHGKPFKNAAPWEPPWQKTIRCLWHPCPLGISATFLNPGWSEWRTAVLSHWRWSWLPLGTLGSMRTLQPQESIKTNEMRPMHNAGARFLPSLILFC